MDRGRDEQAEQALLDLIAGGEDDGSEFLNDSGEGMELENVEGLELQTSTDCDENVGPLTKSGEVYI